MIYSTERRAGPPVIAGGTTTEPRVRAATCVTRRLFSWQPTTFLARIKRLWGSCSWQSGKNGGGCSRACGARDWAHAVGPARGWTAPAARGIQGSDRAQTPEYTASVSGRSRAREPALVGRAQVAGPVPFHAPAGHWAVAPPLRVRGQFGHSTGNAVRTPASAETRTSPAFSPGLFPYS